MANERKTNTAYQVKNRKDWYWNEKRISKCWKDQSKRAHQYRRQVHITIEPGYAVLGDNDCYIIPFNEVYA